QAAAMEERNRLIARILEKNDHDSMLKMLAVSEMPEGNDGVKDKS
ncbi:alpha/beta hydrolase, partial [Salmonella enterica]|nr:alpha/beta hydrolase [Salmonella enterica subsp. enterica serovar Rubislaw]